MRRKGFNVVTCKPYEQDNTTVKEEIFAWNLIS